MVTLDVEGRRKLNGIVGPQSMRPGEDGTLSVPQPGSTPCWAKDNIRESPPFPRLGVFSAFGARSIGDGRLGPPRDRYPSSDGEPMAEPPSIAT